MLAIAEGKRRRSLTLKNEVKDLYTKIFGFSAPRSKRLQEGEKYYLWSWLVDCFPADQGHGVADILKTTSYRSPQNVTRYLIEDTRDGQFLTFYLRQRYKVHGVLAGFNVYENISGATAATQARDAHWGKAEWRAMTRAGERATRREEAGCYERVNPPPRRVTLSDVVMLEVRFHGRDGDFVAKRDHCKDVVEMAVSSGGMTAKKARRACG